MEDPTPNGAPLSDAATLSPKDFEANIYPGLMRGDHEAWVAFYDYYKGRLERFFERSGVYNADDREDLLQKAMMGIFSALPTYDPELGSLRNWVYAVARNIMLQAQKGYSETYDKERTGDTALIRASVEAGDPFEGENEAEDPRLPRLREALGSLREKDQEILVMRSTRTATWEELAQELGKGVSAVKMHYLRALIKLKKAMGIEDY
jgi:RNA polymerase sigma-70 factor (ECF subfamily)